MHLLIRFWDEPENGVKVRYIDLRLFGHATAKDLSKQQFKEITKYLIPTKSFLERKYSKYSKYSNKNAVKNF